MERWIQVLGDIALVEFVLLAALTTLQWAGHRIRGSGWVALSFAILGGLSLTVKIAPGIVHHEDVAKSLIALLLVMLYCLFRFVASFRKPGFPVRLAAALVTIGIVAYTFALGSLPLTGEPALPGDLAYRVAFTVSCGFLIGYVVVRLVMAGVGEPPVAALRMRLLAVAVAGLGVPLVVSALALHGARTQLVTEFITVLIGLLFLVALVLPSSVWVLASRKEDVAFREAVEELVSAGDSEDVGARLLPHVCALVGASSAVLLATDGTVVARYPIWVTGQDADGPRAGSSAGEWAPDVGYEQHRRIAVWTRSGATHELAVKTSPYMPYFGREELRKLDLLAGMIGLAIERCEMAEQVAFQASHDSLTGLANRTLFMQHLADALRHVGRRSSSLAVMFIDLDRFKLVNDRADHTAGDAVLREMAERLTSMTRGVDLVARLGGDEFVAFAEVDRDEDARDMAERVRKGLSEPIEFGEADLVVTSSIGVVVTSEDSDDPALVLRDADNAMYDAKRAGRNRVVLYRSDPRDVANRKWGLNDLERSGRLSAG